METIFPYSGWLQPPYGAAIYLTATCARQPPGKPHNSRVTRRFPYNCRDRWRLVTTTMWHGSYIAIAAWLGVCGAFLTILSGSYIFKNKNIKKILARMSNLGHIWFLDNDPTLVARPEYVSGRRRSLATQHKVPNNPAATHGNGYPKPANPTGFTR
jgi:hypothetical protein